jgi:serine/threonine protein kinase
VTTPGGALIGQWLGEYQLQGLLGVGGMAEVYWARDAVLGRVVAVKVLPLALAADPSYVERFRNEALAVGALNHPNIVPIHVFAEQGPYLYLVMPLIKESLRERLRRGAPLPIADAVQIAVQILSGLGAAHAHGILHRDVKPENILLGEHGVAMLTDFGIARRVTVRGVTGDPTLAGTGLPVGTPQYMAPEQLSGEDLDQRADIYALGAVLYEMLTGQPPHIADNLFEVASLVLSAPIAAPSSRNMEIWPELEQALLKALSRKPADRYATATRFAAALQDALLAKSGNGSSGGQGRVGPNGPPQDPTQQPTIRLSGAPPARNPPRWPPSNQPRGDGAGGGGPGRRILVVALIAAVVLLATCGGAAAFASSLNLLGGGRPTLAQSTETNRLPTETLAPTTTTGPGTPTSTPAPTNTAQPGATATNTAQPGATATNTQIVPTSTPASPTLSVPSFAVHPPPPPPPPPPVYCMGIQTIVNNGPQADGWTWVVTGPSLPPSFLWSVTGPPANNPGLPQGLTQAPNTSWTLHVRMYCSEYAGPYTFHLLDSYGNIFPTSGDVTLTKV